MASVNKSDAYKCLIINNKILYIKRSSSKNMQVKWVHHNLYVIKQALIVQFPIYFDYAWVLRTNLKSIYKIVSGPSLDISGPKLFHDINKNRCPIYQIQCNYIVTCTDAQFINSYKFLTNSTSGAAQTSN